MKYKIENSNFYWYCALFYLTPLKYPFFKTIQCKFFIFIFLTNNISVFSKFARYRQRKYEKARENVLLEFSHGKFRFSKKKYIWYTKFYILGDAVALIILMNKQEKVKRLEEYAFDTFTDFLIFTFRTVNFSWHTLLLAVFRPQNKCQNHFFTFCSINTCFTNSH